MFFSRRIGLTADGQQVPIYGGIRMIGRMKTWDLGIMNMQTKRLDSIPSENFGVLRIRRRVFNENSFMGGMFTSRIDTNGNKNLVYGIDGLIRILGMITSQFNGPKRLIARLKVMQNKISKMADWHWNWHVEDERVLDIVLVQFCLDPITTLELGL